MSIVVVNAGIFCHSAGAVEVAVMRFGEKDASLVHSQLTKTYQRINNRRTVLTKSRP